MASKAGAFEEVPGLDPDLEGLSDRDVDRLEEAIGVVVDRLYRIVNGGRNR